MIVAWPCPDLLAARVGPGFLLAARLVLSAWYHLQCPGGPSRKAASRTCLSSLPTTCPASTSGPPGDTRGATPNIDALARQGVLFERAFCNSPLCTPSRQSFITGLLPHAVGVTRLETPLPENALTLGPLARRPRLSHGGHRQDALQRPVPPRLRAPDRHGRLAQPSAATPRQAAISPPLAALHRPAGRLAERPVPGRGLPAAAMESTYFVDRAIEYLNRNRNHPFAMVVGFYDPHAPFRFPANGEDDTVPSSSPSAALRPRPRRAARLFRDLTDDDFRGIQAAYYTSLSFMDAQIGRLIRALDESGLEQQHAGRLPER